MTIASTYADFAAREARGVSPTYERLTRAISTDPVLVDLLGTVPQPKRQPNLLLAVVRLLGGPVTDPQAFHDFTLTNWPAIRNGLLTRTTQTNEPGRCALLLPILITLPQPLALIEVGASAGLGLFPDRYNYRYNTHRIGDDESAPILDCTLTGAEPPTTRPEIIWRAGLDLNPLNITDDNDLAWLNALIWPEHQHRRDRLHQAAAIAAADPPAIIRGDLVDDLPALAAQAPPHATLVVFHTSVLYQVPPSHRATFTTLMRSLPAHWISVESPEVITFDHLPPPPDATLHNVLALDETPLAWTRSHGQSLTFFPKP
ncbi:hypothetical protein FB565_008035 [Actinoplanes lutulentus]|uniref:Uncharacterized protein DUF2332 n=1 Tax=Actinoplanes lutulentus TaxID=1287878 RepID=A0A327Z7J0_9ACTN|nr:DUF2332 domain-containing protein [Actinoplanes lutulentus]MBB2948252.1 hypothetical protein [Actinoplanes lutulentus]RAK31250.1 uncharacterized protein DUF2332 [Actinoplanes lutulentus]